MAFKDKLQEYALLAEVISALAIVISLLFVGIQIQNGNRESRAATLMAISDQAINFTTAIGTDEHLPRLIALMVQNEIKIADLSTEDNARLRFAMNAGLRRIENLYLQVQLGILQPSALRSVSVGLYQNDYVRELWQIARDQFDPDFAIYMDEVLAE